MFCGGREKGVYWSAALASEMSVHARMTPTAPAFRNGARSPTGPRAGRVAVGNFSSVGCNPQTLYCSLHWRVLIGHSRSATLPCRPSSVKVGFRPAKTSSPVTPAAVVCPEYGKYDVTGALNAEP